MASNTGRVIPVKFGNVSVAVNTASISLKVQRDDLQIENCDTMFANHRLTVVLELIRKTDSEDQRSLVNVNLEFRGICDVKSYTVGPDTFSLTLSFNKNDVDLNELILFSNGAGKVSIVDVAIIPDKDD